MQGGGRAPRQTFHGDCQLRGHSRTPGAECSATYTARLARGSRWIVSFASAELLDLGPRSEQARFPSSRQPPCPRWQACVHKGSALNLPRLGIALSVALGSGRDPRAGLVSTCPQRWRVNNEGCFPPSSLGTPPIGVANRALCGDCHFLALIWIRAVPWTVGDRAWRYGSVPRT